MELKLAKKGKGVKNQFVLNVGDDGAILSHFHDGKLANKLYVDSPFSNDVKLIERLCSSYPKTPIYMLVDVIEQTYSQQVLPPVSQLGIRNQIQRRMKRDFQPQDLNNVLPLGRSKEGRKDWIYLFISLANTDPFAKWLEIMLNQSNPFKGVYLAPVESTKLMSQLQKTQLNTKETEWELLVLHNKTGGFRISTFRSGKLIFTRLAQNLIGDNIPDIVVGNMEQEISNTVEYLKRLGFKGEAESRIIIVAGSDILNKVEPKSLKFGYIELLTPYQAAQKLNLPESVTEKDKFADILTSAHFAVTGRHMLKFVSDFTRKIDMMYMGIKTLMSVMVIAGLSLVGFAGYQVYDVTQKLKEREQIESRAAQATAKLNETQSKKNALPKNIDRMLDTMALSKLFYPDQYNGLRMMNALNPIFGVERVIKSVFYKESENRSEKTKKTSINYYMELEFDYNFPAEDKDLLNTKSSEFLKQVAKVFPDAKVEWMVEPKLKNQSQFEPVNDSQNQFGQGDMMTLPAKIKITGISSEI